MNSQIKRRDFMKFMGASAGAIGAAGLIGSRVSGQEHTGGHGEPGQDGMGGEGGTAQTWQEMNAHHQEGVQIFLDNIGKDTTFWRPALEPVMDGDVKVFNITCQDIMWDTGGGMEFPAFAYNGLVPGPEIRVTEGDKVRLVVTNEMSESTAIHFHGLLVPNSVDGVPFITQPTIDPGQTFTYEFTVRNFGSHMYHSHHNAAEQVTRGLLGAFIVEPKDKSREPQITADYTMILNDSALGFTLNGKGFPYTQPIIAKLGDKIRVRYMNEGLMIHPMHLHGIPQLVLSKDGYYLPLPFLCDTLNIAPGERYDVIIDCTELGVWAFHCHILSHAESRDGMFGMVTVLIVQE
ncbi:MAG: copper oxidase [Anaerolineae bacterium]|nr:copper oxidase [Anaerolineae bacterium]